MRRGVVIGNMVLDKTLLTNLRAHKNPLPSQVERIEHFGKKHQNRFKESGLDDLGRWINIQISKTYGFKFCRATRFATTIWALYLLVLFFNVISRTTHQMAGRVSKTSTYPDLYIQCQRNISLCRCRKNAAVANMLAFDITSLVASLPLIKIVRFLVISLTNNNVDMETPVDSLCIVPIQQKYASNEKWRSCGVLHRSDAKTFIQGNGWNGPFKNRKSQTSWQSLIR